MGLETFPEFQPNITITSWESPFIEEPSHSYLFNETEIAFLDATEEINSFSKRLLDTGLEETLLESKNSGQSIGIKFMQGDLNVSYVLGYLGKGDDTFTQTLDVFNFSKLPDQNPGFVQQLRLGFIQNNFSPQGLKTFSTKDDELPIESHFFQFHQGDLVFIGQLSKPGLLFPQIPINGKQFLICQMIQTKEDQDKSLLVRVGVGDGKISKEGYYENIGGSIVKSDLIRVADVLSGELELITENPEGNDTVWASFSLPGAVKNLSQFLPATNG